MSPKILFLSNRRSIPYSDGYSTYSITVNSGLSTSIDFVVNMLRGMGFDANYVQVYDSNGINKVVTEQAPDIVMLEAVWVTPEKLTELTKIHPSVRWNIRIHSELPFLAHEGNAITWLAECARLPMVSISSNSNRISDELGHALNVGMLYLPNYYDGVFKRPVERYLGEEYLDIGCFGAIRPMKNHLTQAVAAIYFADVEEKTLRFHVNVNREETGGNNVLKNLRALFTNNGKHILVEHPWMPHREFLELIEQMNICLQVSLSETFNIVTADAVAIGVPVVVSPEIRWLPSSIQSSPNNAENIAQVLIETHYRMVTDGTDMMLENQDSLRSYNDHSRTAWIEFMNNTI